MSELPTSEEYMNWARATERGIEWLLQQQDRDGGIQPEKGIGCYYKIPWVFAATGHAREGRRLLGWIRRNNFAGDGDFRGRYPRGAVHQAYYPYSNAWIICGAQKLGEFDLSLRGIEFLVTLQDADTGGFYTPKEKGVPHPQEILWPSCMAGMACLYVGRLESTLRVADFAKTVWELQPQTDRLYYVLDKDKGLVTQFPAEKASAFVVDTTLSRVQGYFIPGLVAAFLTQLYQATQETSYLDLAKEYMRFAIRCQEFKYQTAQVGKIGWGAALLYQVTGDGEYAEVASKVANALAGMQSGDGYWPRLDGPRELYRDIDLTAEFVALLTEMATRVAP